MGITSGPMRKRKAPARSPARGRSSPSIAIVVSRYNATITDKLLAGAESAFIEHAPTTPAPRVIDAPGAFELPTLALAAAASGLFDGVLALGCIIRGETSHDQHLAGAVAHGLVGVALRTGVPVSLGVLTVNNPRQARDRAGGKHGNKGHESMIALLQTIQSVRALRESGVNAAPTDLPSSTRAIRALSFPDKLARTPSRAPRGGTT
jgi:6,7-dimethyl-8-ribityllumazine synthase